MRKVAVLTLIVSIALCTGVTSIFLVREGFRHVLPTSALRQAEQYWQTGPVDKSLPAFLSAFWMALESGVRWSIANTYIDQMRLLQRDGKLQGAVEQCATAVRIVGGYDDEGGLSYACTVIEETIKRQSLSTPNSKSKP